MTRIGVILVEDDPRFLEALGALLRDSALIEVVGRYTSGKAALAGIVEKRPDVALIELGLPDISGAAVIWGVRARGCQTECVVLTHWDDDAHLFAALRAGAVGYLIKHDASLPELVRVIQDARDGGAPMSQGIARRILQELQEPVKLARNLQLEELSPRELEILEYQAKGFTARKVAQALYISYETVRSHQKAIYKKLHVHSLAEAVAVLRGKKGFE
jgi:DNA-binding NarL/FixJ family response regulator